MPTLHTSWKRVELVLLVVYAAIFYVLVINRSVKLSAEYTTGDKSGSLWGMRHGFWTRLNDNSDSQWRSFHGNLLMLSAVMAIFMLISITVRSLWHLSGRGMARLWLLLSAAYILHLHGTCTIFILSIAGGNYFLVKVLASTPGLTIVLWLYNLIFIVSNRVYEGYLFSSFGASFAFLDNYRGVLRWHIGYNFVMLRMVSFGIDYHWAFLSRMSTVNWEKHNQNCELCRKGSACYLTRQENSLPLSDYSLEAYLCYLFYPPLYIAGPIISFNAFASQLESPQKTFTTLDIVLYGLRWVTCLGLMETLTHFCYYNSLAISGVWQMLSAWEIFIVGYGVLNFMWLKFLLIWRFFRFWALVGGIEVVENMPRCVNNCYDLEGFWKSWHASYNRWLVRYLYVPLGGTHWRVLNVWVIFTFVAVWHDLDWKLLSWAWITCLLMAPEAIIKGLMRSAKMQTFRKSFLHHELCAVLGALNISGLMMANIIGFVVGPQGMHWLISRMLEKQNFSVICGILCSFYVGTKGARTKDSRYATTLGRKAIRSPADYDNYVARKIAAGWGACGGCLKSFYHKRSNKVAGGGVDCSSLVPNNASSSDLLCIMSQVFPSYAKKIHTPKLALIAESFQGAVLALWGKTRLLQEENSLLRERRLALDDRVGQVEEVSSIPSPRGFEIPAFSSLKRGLILVWSKRSMSMSNGKQML